jgi:vacuolar-type H+-ATPase subunit H
MSTKNGRAKVMEKHGTRPVMDGLDDDIASFINSLIDQNSELVNRLRHVDSLKELADKTVLEARKEAVSIKAEAEEKAAKIITGAEKKARAAARKIINRAKKKAEEEARSIIKKTCIDFNEKSGSTSPDGRTMCCVLVTRVKRAALQLAEYLETQGEAVQVRCRDENSCMHQLWEVRSSKYI